MDLPTTIAIFALALSAYATYLADQANRRLRPSVKVEAKDLPPYNDGQKTTFVFTNVGSGDIVNPDSYAVLSWEPDSRISLPWGETTTLSPTQNKEIAIRLPDPFPKGQSHKIEVYVSGSNIKFPKRDFVVNA